MFERDTGGDLTPQDPGIVNLSLAFRMDGEGAAIKDAYMRLTAPVLAYLRDRHGIEAHLSAIPGAFCEAPTTSRLEIARSQARRSAGSCGRRG